MSLSPDGYAALSDRPTNRIQEGEVIEKKKKQRKGEKNTYKKQVRLKDSSIGTGYEREKETKIVKKNTKKPLFAFHTDLKKKKKKQEKRNVLARGGIHRPDMEMERGKRKREEKEKTRPNMK